MKKMNKKGFTIVELVIVIAVIAILAAVLIPTFSNIIAKANESSALQACRNELIELKAALAITGTDVPENTIFVSGDYAFGYANGSLSKVEGNAPTEGLTQLANVKAQFPGIASAKMLTAAEKNDITTPGDFNKNSPTVSVACGTSGSEGSASLTIYKDGASLYQSTRSTSGTEYFIVSLCNAASADAAGYYTYDLTTNNTTVTTGAFYYNGQ